MRSLVRGASTTLIVTLITLVLCEISLRLADFRILRDGIGERSLTYDYDAALGWAPVPNSSATVTTARTIHAQHNSLGLRDIAFQPDGRPVMMFVGDSFVWGVDAEAGERFTDLLRDRLPNVQIVNAGVSGYGTDQEFLLTQRLWDRIKPDVLVLIFCSANDRRDNSNNVRYDDYQKPYFTIENDALVVHNQPVPESRQLYIRRNWLVRHAFVARALVSAYVEIAHPRVTVPDPTEKLVSAMQDFAQAHAARFLVGLQFPDAALMRHLAARKIPFTSFEDAEAYGADSGGHWTPAGNRLVADRLLRLFAETGIAQGASSQGEPDRRPPIQN
jgi:lysophospholipase L1-like esterase